METAAEEENWDVYPIAALERELHDEKILILFEVLLPIFNEMWLLSDNPIQILQVEKFNFNRPSHGNIPILLP